MQSTGRRKGGGSEKMGKIRTGKTGNKEKQKMQRYRRETDRGRGKRVEEEWIA